MDEETDIRIDDFVDFVAFEADLNIGISYFNIVFIFIDFLDFGMGFMIL